MKKVKELIKLMERLIKNDHLFSPEKVKEMKIELKQLKDKLKEIEKTTSKGFGKI
jgi:hypothetical protein